MNDWVVCQGKTIRYLSVSRLGGTPMFCSRTNPFAFVTPYYLFFFFQNKKGVLDTPHVIGFTIR